MGIWLELGIFGLVFVFAFWQMHDVRKAQEQTRQQRAREKAAKQTAEVVQDQPTTAEQATNETGKSSWGLRLCQMVF